MDNLKVLVVGLLLGLLLGVVLPVSAGGGHERIKARLDKLEDKTSRLDKTGQYYKGTVLLPKYLRDDYDPDEEARWHALAPPLDKEGFMLRCGPRS